MGGGGKGGSSGNAQRAVTQQELDLWDSQKKNLDSLTKIAEEQYNLSTEDRNYYEKVFREGTDTEAKTALAKLQSHLRNMFSFIQYNIRQQRISTIR
jgi:hypothetical protein